MTDLQFATLQEFRRAIDEIDVRIVLSLRERKLVVAALRQKRVEAGLERIDERREAVVVDHFETAAPGSRYVARTIMNFCEKDGDASS